MNHLLVFPFAVQLQVLFVSLKRVNAHNVYSKFVPHLLDNWENVKEKCQGAKKFEEEIREKWHIS